MPTTGSTNSDLVSAVTSDPQAWPEFSIFGTDFQSEGRGRSGRSWQAPAGSSLFVSVLLKPPPSSISAFGWLPLLAGLAVRDTLGSAGLEERAKVKWPNDVLIGDKKISGVLSEYVASAGAVVVGVGINLLQTRDQLPVELATSLSIEGVDGFSGESVLEGYLRNLRVNYELLVAAHFDAQASGLRAKVLAACATVGHPVRAILPGDQEFSGVATDIDGTGRLVIRKDSDGSMVTISAGDIVHLRHFDLSSERIVS